MNAAIFTEKEVIFHQKIVVLENVPILWVKTVKTLAFEQMLFMEWLCL